MKKVLSSIIGLLLIFAGAFAIQNASAQNNSKFTPEQVKQIQSIIHEYLIKNPNVLVEVSQALQAQEMVKIEKEAKVKIKQNAQQIFADPDSPVVGNEKGTVTLVEFFDYQCPHCKAMVKPLQNLIKKNKNVRVVFKQLPIFGSNSKYAAEAALAVWKFDKNKFYLFNDALLNTENPLTADKVKKVAKRLEIDVDKLEKTIKDDKAIQKQINDNLALASKLGIRGTPTFIVGHWQVGKTASDQTNLKPKLIPGATDEATLEKELKNNSSNNDKK